MTKIVTYAMAKPYETMKNRFKKSPASSCWG